MQDTFTVGGKPVAVIRQQQAPSWTAADVAKYFGVSRKRVYGWVYEGKIPVHRTPGGRLRFVEAEVKAAQLKKEAQ